MRKKPMISDFVFIVLLLFLTATLPNYTFTVLRFYIN